MPPCAGRARPAVRAAQLRVIDLAHEPRRLATETKSSLKTTELIVYVLSVAGVLIAALVTDNNNDGQSFNAHQAWFLVTLLTIGYMVSRGLRTFSARRL